MSWLLDKIRWAQSARLKSANAVPASDTSESQSIAPPADAPDTLSSVAMRVTGETVERHRPDDVLAHEFPVKPREDESAPSKAADDPAQSEETSRSATASTDSSMPEQAAVGATPEEQARFRTRTAEIAAANAQKKAESDRKRKNREQSRI